MKCHRVDSIYLGKSIDKIKVKIQKIHTINLVGDSDVEENSA